MKSVLVKCVLFIVVLCCALSFPFAQSLDNRVDLPETALGKLAARWIEAINSGDAGKINTFVENNFSTAALKEQSAAKRAAYFRKLHEQSGSGGGRTDLQMLWNSGYTVIVQTNQTPPSVTTVSNEIVAFLAKQAQVRKRTNSAKNGKPRT